MRRALAAVLVVSMSVIVPSVGAGAAPPDKPTGKASYNGRTIELSKSWDTAQACAVITADDVRCFDSAAAMDEALGSSASTPPADQTSALSGTVSLLSVCGGNTSAWVYLYANSNYGGRVLQFQDEGFWQNLSTWGFDNQMSSWWNSTGCTAYAASNANGGGTWLTMPGNTANATVPGSFNDVASSLYIT